MSEMQAFQDDSIKRFSTLLAEMSSRCKTKAQLREIHRLTDTFIAFLDRLECADVELDDKEMSSTSDGSQSSNAPSRKKLVVIGDRRSGKTSMLIKFCYGQSHDTYVPTVFDNYVASLEDVNGKEVEIALWDTAGQEDYDQLRKLSYPNTDVFLACFSVDSPDSLKNVVEKWGPEARFYRPDTPIVLVATNKDLRNNPGTISEEEGKEATSKIQAVAYVECSAETGEGIEEVFRTAAHEALKSKDAGRSESHEESA